MKKETIAALAALVIICAVGLYLVKPDFITHLTGGKTQESTAPHHSAGGDDASKPTASPSEDQGTGESASVEISPEKQQLIGVRIVEATLRPLEKTIRTVGRIEYDERKTATVTTKFEGWIEKLHVDYAGKFVKKGDPLCEIYSPELLATQKEFLSLLKWRSREGTHQARSDTDRMLARDAESLIAAARERLSLWDITDDQIRRVEETGTPIRILVLYSPVSGHVTRKTATQGAHVMAGATLFDIADLSTVWLISDIYEHELPLVSTGQTAAIALSYFPGKEFSSAIDYVYPALAGETRTARVRFVIPNPEVRLKPHMFTNVVIRIQLGRRLAVPEDAVIDTGTRQIVYRDKGEGHFEPKEVTTGLQGEGYVEIIRGLKPGEKVAASAAFLIDSEARLKGVVK